MHRPLDSDSRGSSGPLRTSCRANTGSASCLTPRFRVRTGLEQGPPGLGCPALAPKPDTTIEQDGHGLRRAPLTKPARRSMFLRLFRPTRPSRSFSHPHSFAAPCGPLSLSSPWPLLVSPPRAPLPLHHLVFCTDTVERSQVDGLLSTVEDGYNGATETIGEAAESGLDAAQSIATGAFTTFESVVDGATQTIVSAFGEVSSTCSTLHRHSLTLLIPRPLSGSPARARRRPRSQVRSQPTPLRTSSRCTTA